MHRIEIKATAETQMGKPITIAKLGYPTDSGQKGNPSPKEFGEKIALMLEQMTNTANRKDATIILCSIRLF